MKYLEKEMIEVNNKIEELISSNDKNMQDVINWVLQVRGKQLRPQLLISCAKFGTMNKDIIEYAAIVEITHSASLVHDDIIDNAQQRRGIESVQKKFGQQMAVYAGDYMIFSALSKMKVKPNETLHILFDAANTLCTGELGQYDNLYNINVTKEQYLQNVYGKTAVFFEASCKIGATSAKCKKQIITAVSEYGKYLGLIFQLRDDLLDFGLGENIGKPILQDFVNGIYTLPILFAMENGYKKDLEKLAEKIKNNENIQIIKDELSKIVKQSNGIEETRKLISEYKEKAIEKLNLLPNGENKDFLRDVLMKVSDI